MFQERDLKDKNVIATGGASGITKAICDHFLKKGINRLAILDLDYAAGNIAAREFNEIYGADKVVFKNCDVSNESEVDSTVDEIFESFGSIDILVNGAGLANEVDWKVCVNVNLIAVIYLSLKIRNMTRADRGGQGATIVNISSVRGVRPNHYAPVYIATKCGVIGFSKSLGDPFHYERTKVRILTLCPGVTDTPILKAASNIPEISAFIDQHFKSMPIVQCSDHVGVKTMDIFEKGDSGSVWIVEDESDAYQV